MSHSYFALTIDFLNTNLKYYNIQDGRCEDIAKDRKTRDHLAWTIVNGDPMHGVYISHRILRA